MSGIAHRVRAYLEQLWPQWHAVSGRALQTPLSRGTCQTSSLFLQKVLASHGWDASVACGNIPDCDVGFFDGHLWHGHAWVCCDGFIIDITADQFGQPPVRICTISEKTYRAGGTDTAYPSAISSRESKVQTALKGWHAQSDRTGVT